MRVNRFQIQRQSEAGMTLIELLIAGAVLVVGMLSIMGLLMLAVGNNGRSKLDTTSTMLAQAVVEQISAKIAGGGPGTLTDCNGSGTTWTIDYSSGTGSAGANLSNGAIDFTQAQSSVTTGYYMNYVECSGNVQNTYDVRWNIQSLSASNTYLVTVGARPGALPTRFSFAIPVTLRTYVGN
jgi:Tfp pilus assembly protein PilV